MMTLSEYPHFQPCPGPLTLSPPLVIQEEFAPYIE